MAAVQSLPITLPDADTLRAGLSSMVAGSDASGQSLTVVHREPYINASTFASEVVTCRLEDGLLLPLFCKYTAKHWGPPGDQSWGYKRGVLHEAAVYQRVLQPLGVAVPRFYGLHTEPLSGESWMVLQYLEKSVRVNLTVRAEFAMKLAAGWVGRFHALAEAHPRPRSWRFLRGHDRAYYAAWVQRTLEYAGHWHQEFPWLTRLADLQEGWVPLLLARPTVIHGEYSPKNILFLNAQVFPVDWESAAIAAGEIDLAALTEGWPAATVAHCIRAYRQARWPSGAPPDFDRTMDAARLFNAFRWLGDEPEQTRAKGMRLYFHELRRVAKRLGLLT
jgi:hypothetical protein